MGKCKFCDRPDEGDPSDHYHYHKCWADDVRRRIDFVKVSFEGMSGNPDLLKRMRDNALRDLEEELERAKYVGD